MCATEDTSDLSPRHQAYTPRELQHQLTAAINDMTDPEKQDILQLIENSIKNGKRRGQRHRQLIKAEVLNRNRVEKGTIENLSPGGAFLTARQFYSPGTEIKLSFSVLNFEFPVKLNAEVMWISPKGMGLKFKSSQKLDYRLAAQKLADALGPAPTEPQ